VEVSPQFVETRLRDVFLDVVVIALVATLMALELVLAVAVGSVGKPLDRVLRLLSEQSESRFVHRIRSGGLPGLGRAAARLNDQAVDLAERLAALPAAARARLAATVDAQIANGRPVRLRLSDFNDIRLALFLFSLATEIAAAFLPLYARAAARPYWLSPEMAAAALLALYLIAVAIVSPFGGALARRFGPRRLFLAAVPPTALALIAMGLSDDVVGIALARAATAVFYAIATIACHEYTRRAAGHAGGARAALVRRRSGLRFPALLAGIVAPMNAATAIFIRYLSPLMLSAAGHGPAEIARVVMLYYLAIVLLSPAMAGLSDVRFGPVTLVLTGSAAAGLALLSLGLWSGFWAVTLSVAGLGVGHSFIRAPHYALALMLAEGGGDLGALRLVERSSALLGLLLSALFLADIGAESTVTIPGVAVLTGAAAFGIVELAGRSTPPSAN